MEKRKALLVGVVTGLVIFVMLGGCLLSFGEFLPVIKEETFQLCIPEGRLLTQEEASSLALNRFLEGGDLSSRTLCDCRDSKGYFCNIVEFSQRGWNKKCLIEDNSGRVSFAIQGKFYFTRDIVDWKLEGNELRVLTKLNTVMVMFVIGLDTILAVFGGLVGVSFWKLEKQRSKYISLPK